MENMFIHTEQEIRIIIYTYYIYIYKSVKKLSTIVHKNNETNDKFYRKIAFLLYTEMVNFRP